MAGASIGGIIGGVILGIVTAVAIGLKYWRGKRDGDCDVSRRTSVEQNPPPSLFDKAMSTIGSPSLFGRANFNNITGAKSNWYLDLSSDAPLMQDGANGTGGANPYLQPVDNTSFMRVSLNVSQEPYQDINQVTDIVLPKPDPTEIEYEDVIRSPKNGRANRRARGNGEPYQDVDTISESPCEEGDAKKSAKPYQDMDPISESPSADGDAKNSGKPHQYVSPISDTQRTEDDTQGSGKASQDAKPTHDSPCTKGGTQGSGKSSQDTAQESDYLCETVDAEGNKVVVPRYESSVRKGGTGGNEDDYVDLDSSSRTGSIAEGSGKGQQSAERLSDSLPVKGNIKTEYEEAVETPKSPTGFVKGRIMGLLRSW